MNDFDVSTIASEVLTGKGYVIVNDLFDPGPVLSSIASEMTKPGPIVAGGHRPNVIGYPAIQELLTNPNLLTLGELVLRQRPAFGSLGVNVIPPGSPGMDPHIDYPYFSMAQRPALADPALCLQLIWYPVDVTPEMGATFVLEGSQEDPSITKTEALSCFNRQVIEARAGSLFIGHGALWHGVLPNSSDKMRPAVLGSYIPYWCRPMTRVHVPLGVSPDLAKLMCADFGQRVGHDYGRITE